MSVCVLRLSWMPASWCPTRSSTRSFRNASISRNAVNGFILDGYPRTLVPGRAVEQNAGRTRASNSIASSSSKLMTNVLVERIENRVAETPRRMAVPVRHDDNPEAVQASVCDEVSREDGAVCRQHYAATGELEDGRRHGRRLRRCTRQDQRKVMASAACRRLIEGILSKKD